MITEDCNVDYELFFDVIQEKLIEEDYGDLCTPVPCPYCDSRDTEYVDGLLYPTSFNVFGSKCSGRLRCNECKKESSFSAYCLDSTSYLPIYCFYEVEEPHKIIKGLPHYLDSRTFTCSKCGGNVKAHMSNDMLRNLISICDGCGQRGRYESTILLRKSPQLIEYLRKEKEEKERLAQEAKKTQDLADKLGIIIVDGFIERK